MTTTAKWRRRYREWKAEKEVSSYVSLATVGIAATASHINRNTDEDTSRTFHRSANWRGNELCHSVQLDTVQMNLLIRFIHKSTRFLQFNRVNKPLEIL